MEKIKELVNEFSNNFELGAAVRQYIRDLKESDTGKNSNG